MDKIPTGGTLDWWFSWRKAMMVLKTFKDWLARNTIRLYRLVIQKFLVSCSMERFRIKSRDGLE